MYPVDELPVIITVVVFKVVTTVLANSFVETIAGV